jgi:hypothetical protein
MSDNTWHVWKATHRETGDAYAFSTASDIRPSVEGYEYKYLGASPVKITDHRIAEKPAGNA